MFQIDNASAATTQPPSTAPGTAGFFTDGNPATSVPATIVPAEWLNSVMMELINAVTGSGQTPDKTKFNQLLTAIQNAGGNIGITPPQFDNSTKTATTAFVQRALGSKSNWTTVNAATTLTAAHIGQNITCGGSASFTVTLPLTTTIPAGGVISLRCSASQTITIAAQGSEAIGYGASSTPSVSLKQGDTLDLLSTNQGTWFIIGGSAALPYSSNFTAQNSAYFSFSNTSISVPFNNNTVNLATIPVTFPAASRTGKFRLMGSASSGGTWGNSTGSYIYSNFLNDPTNGGANIAGLTNVAYFGTSNGFEQTTPVLSPFLYSPGATINFALQANSNLNGTTASYVVRLMALEA